MKKILSLCFLLVCVGSTYAQNHLPQSFLNGVRSIQVSNVNAISNLVLYPGMTNIYGTVYTNGSGTRVTITNAGDTTALIKAVDLFPDRNGALPFYQFNSVPGTQTNYQQLSHLTLVGKILGGAGANSAVTFTFTPKWKDEVSGEQPFTATTHDWAVAVTAASGVVTFATNAPLHLWPGAKGLYLRSVVNADTDFTGNIFIQQLDLVGFRP